MHLKTVRRSGGFSERGSLHWGQLLSDGGSCNQCSSRVEHPTESTTRFSRVDVHRITLDLGYMDIRYTHASSGDGPPQLPAKSLRTSSSSPSPATYACIRDQVHFCSRLVQDMYPPPAKTARSQLHLLMNLPPPQLHSFAMGWRTAQA